MTSRIAPFDSMDDTGFRILVDENVPCANAAFGTLGTVRTRPGREIRPADVRNVDALIVRSVTDVGPALLDNSPIQFVGSATIGTDHVDQEYLAAEGIAFAHAPASNADSVADYITASLLHLATARNVRLDDLTIGIVGVGNIGGRLARRLPALGASVRLNDPPRASETPTLKRASGDPIPFEPLGDVLAASDVVTLHVPLTRTGPGATHHLVDADRLAALTPGTWLINTSRGAVIDNAALAEHLATGSSLGALVLDVWEGEPTPDPVLVDAADLATPHIAGYAFDGKVRGTSMLYTALCDHLGTEETWTPEAVLAPDTPDALRCTPPDPRLPRTDYLHALARQVYDVTADDARLRPYVQRPADERGTFFSRLRKTYPVRREMQATSVPASSVPDAYRDAVATGLTIQLAE